jgi:hypothetical protein
MALETIERLPNRGALTFKELEHAHIEKLNHFFGRCSNGAF